MKARVKVNVDSIVLYLDGKVNFESQIEVCETLKKTLRENTKPDRPVIVNFSGLDFVGSSGITQFVQNLRNVHQENGQVPKYCGVRSEFQKIIRAFDEDREFEFFEDETLTAKTGIKKSNFDH